jgi:hypothetical protein
MTTQIGIYDHATGEQIVREMTAEELAEREAIATDLANREAATTAAQAAKLSAQTKLEALGLTTDDLKALGL